MSVHMKKRLTEESSKKIAFNYNDKTVMVPEKKAGFIIKELEKYMVDSPKKDSISSDDLFADIYKKYSKAGAILKGARLKENLTQAELAKKLEIEQPDLSKMESGKRPIGKKLAKRFSAVLNINYRAFL